MTDPILIRVAGPPSASARLMPFTHQAAVSVALPGGNQRAVALMSILSARALVRELTKAIRDAERLADYA